MVVDLGHTKLMAKTITIKEETEIQRHLEKKNERNSDKHHGEGLDG